MNVSHDTLRLHRRTAMIISFIMQVPPFEAIPTQTIPNVDVLIGNETDATTFVETDGWEEQDVPFIVKRLSALVVIMQGAHTAIVSVSGETARSKEKLVDNNGARDAYVGVPRLALCRGRACRAVCSASAYISGAIVQQSGCTFPPKLDFTDTV